MEKISVKHLITTINYLGVGFIAGSISHGFFSGTRSIITALLGIFMFILGQFLEKKFILHEKNRSGNEYIRIAITGLIFSIGIGMVSGGFQHLQDSPLRSLWIIPLGYTISLLIYPKKEHLTKVHRFNLLLTAIIVSALLYILLYFLIHTLPESFFVGGDHHA